MRILRYEIIYVFVISSLSVYVILGAGWASNSKFAILGAYRSVAQTISYEVIFSILVLGLLVCVHSFNLGQFLEIKFLFFFMCPILFGVWAVVILAETNRTPFDFAEGESELVSGFNVEYGSVLFAFLFMAEYGNIIFFSFLSSFLFFSSSFFMFILGIGGFLWVRRTYVRFRYDNLIILA